MNRRPLKYQIHYIDADGNICAGQIKMWQPDWKSDDGGHGERWSGNSPIGEMVNCRSVEAEPLYCSDIEQCRCHRSGDDPAVCPDRVLTRDMTDAEWDEITRGRTAGANPNLAAPYGKSLWDDAAIRSEMEKIADQKRKQLATHTCIGKGGLYRKLGTAQGAGDLKATSCMVYIDVETGALYVRNIDDFNNRMKEL